MYQDRNFADIRFTVPNLCKNTSVLIIVLITQLSAIVIALLGHQGGAIVQLGMISLYLHWCVLSTTGLLCVLRSKLNKMPTRNAVLLALASCLICFLITELLAQYILGLMDYGHLNTERLLSFFGVALIVTLLVLRLFSILTTIEQRNKAEMLMRIQALQSRIRPHFLFNSLNTIAELTATEPKHAEQAIDSLSLLFRASLESDKRFHSLENELNLCRRYIELERWRLDTRLTVDWAIEVKNPTVHQVPKLILQPLIENGILHGVMNDGTIKVSVDIRETNKDLSIVIENGKGSENVLSEGHGIAVDNIRERLFVLYDDQQTFRVRQTDEGYSVLMRFPKQNLNQVSRDR